MVKKQSKKEFTDLFTRATRRLHKSLVRATRKTRQARATALRKTHHKVRSRVKWYDRWHQTKHHKKIHTGTAVAMLVLFVYTISILSAPARAFSTWNQTDWSGGLGSSTANQYSAASNVDTSVAGQVSLPKTQKLSNGDFNGNLNGWDGMNKTYNSSTYRTGAGSAKVTVPAAGSSMFQTNTSIAAGCSVQDEIQAADFNSDGYNDLVTSCYNAGNNISVWMNNGNGSFTPGSQATYAVAARAMGIDTGDVNGDGKPDIVTGGYGLTCKISVLINNGNGTFANSVDYGPPAWCHNGALSIVKLSHVNSDQYLDIIGYNGYGDGLYILLNNGNGTFGTISESNPNGNQGYNMALCDLNGDAKNDIVMGSQSSKFTVLLANGSSFGAPITIATAVANFHLDCADVDNDGYGDVVTLNSNSWDMYYYHGNGNGSFASATDVAIDIGNKSYIKLGDINNDGNLDILNSAQYYIGNGNGTFGAAVSHGAPAGGDIELADLNNDGKLDILNVQAGTTNYYLGYSLNINGGSALTQSFNAGDTSTYYLEAYAYTTGAAVTSADAELYYNGAAVATTYTDAGGGWWRLRGSVTGANQSRAYGVQAKPSKTVYFDDMSVYKYPTSGSLTSNVFDLGYGGDWGNLSYVTGGQGTVAVKVRSSNDANMAGAPAFSSCNAISSGTDLTSTNCMTNNHRYIQYDIALTPGGHDSPVLSDLSIDYLPWDNTTPTTNASSPAMKRAAGADDISSNGWTNHQQPYFSWTAGVDDVGGSGIKGYCAYLGQSSSADPISTKGLLGNSPVATNGECQFITSSNSLDLATITGGTAMTTSDTPYYLNLKAVDNAGNVYAGASTQFQFRFDNTPPGNPSFVTAPSQFINTKATTITWPNSGGDGPSDANAGVAGLQYKIGGSTWYGDSHSGTQDASDLLTNDGSYATQNTPDYANIAEGNNIIYFRTWDAAGNVSTANITTVLKINTTGAPSSPQNVSANPTTNTSNSFAFSWLAPASYVGQASNITYCYTVNSTPTVNNCTFTAAGQTSLLAGAYATQPGDNTFYVVAKDESGNINYATAASTTFTANTAAPGMPLNIDIADTSVKSTANWRLAISWETPASVGAGVASYRIYRSTDNNNFTQVASTAGTSYVDSGLSAQEYYYKVKACDSANNCGADSATVNMTPTGKYTTPADLISNPKVESLSTRKTTIGWVTDRNSDSRIAYGTKSGSYYATEAASSEQVTGHQIELNGLTAGTTYYYKAKWVDGDGNVGQSAEYSFTTAPSPVCKNVKPKSVSLSSAVIELTCRDAVKVKVLYGKSDQFGGQKIINTSSSESTYEVELAGLDDGSRYSYQLNTFDADSNEYEGSVIFSFDTPARPRISNLRFQPVDGEPTSTQKVTWDTNVAATSEIAYGTGGLTSLESLDSKLVTSHELIIRNLTDNSEYALVARSRDAGGNLATSDRQIFRTALDTRPPKISAVVVEPSVKGTGTESRGQIIVTWKTDEPTTSQVAYGIGNAAELTNKTAEDNRLTSEHVVIVSDLSTSQVYSVQAVAKDVSKNEAKSKKVSTITGRASDNVLTIIFNALQQIFGIK